MARDIAAETPRHKAAKTSAVAPPRSAARRAAASAQRGPHRRRHALRRIDLATPHIGVARRDFGGTGLTKFDDPGRLPVPPAGEIDRPRAVDLAQPTGADAA